MALAPDILCWPEEHHKILARLQRYRTANQNAVTRHRKAIEDYRKNRAAEKQSEQKQVIATERHAIYKEKNKPAPTFDETVALMRKRAIALCFTPPDLKPGAVK